MKYIVLECAYWYHLLSFSFIRGYKKYSNVTFISKYFTVNVLGNWKDAAENELWLQNVSFMSSMHVFKQAEIFTI